MYGFLKIVTLIGAYADSTTLLILSSILCGFSGYGLVIICYVIASDVCEENFRQQITLFMNLFFSFGPFLFFFLYNWCNEWYNILVLFMIIPTIGLIAIIGFLVQESPGVYLCKQRNVQKCLSSLTAIAIYNKKTNEEIAQISDILKKAELPTHTENNNKEIWNTIKQWKYLKIIICMGIAESGANVFFYGIEFAVNDIGFNYGFDNLVMGITEMLMVVIVSRFITSLPRKKTMYIVYPLTVLVSFSFIFLGSNKYISTALILCIRSLTSIGYFMVVMVQT